MQQLSLMLEPGIAAVHPTLKSCLNTCIVSGQGVVAIAGKLDMSHSKLSQALSGADDRKLDVNELEAYIQATGDTRPIQYLVAKYMRDPVVLQQEAMAQLAKLAEAIPNLMAAAGLAPTQKRGSRS